MMLLWVTGGLMLLAGILLTYLLKPRKASEALYRVRLHRNRRALRLLRRLHRSKHPCTRTLQAASPTLLTALRRMNRRITSLPPLPADTDGDPRVLDAARDAADAPEISGEALLDALAGNALSSVEVLFFPVCVAWAQSYRLTTVLTSLWADVRQADQAKAFLRRLRRSKQPARLLQKCTLNSFGLHALHQALAECRAEALQDMLTNWLLEMDLTIDDLDAAVR